LADHVFINVSSVVVVVVVVVVIAEVSSREVSVDSQRASCISI
jgi:hypothetical protein